MRLLAWALAGAGIALQMVFPLVDGPKDGLTIAVVVLLAAAALTHAAWTRGALAAFTLLAVVGGGGLLAEAVGVATGVPFGAYDYADSLGPKLLGVPLVIPLAWVMLAYPALLVGRRLAASYGTLAVIATAAWALASWDLFLDPQMVDAGHWTWTDPTPSLPGVDGIPLTNYLGWLAVALVLMAVLHATLPDRRQGDDALPATVYLWTYASSVLANAVFFGRPWVALVGGVAMGLVALPYARSLLPSAQQRAGQPA